MLENYSIPPGDVIELTFEEVFFIQRKPSGGGILLLELEIEWWRTATPELIYQRAIGG